MDPRRLARRTLNLAAIWLLLTLVGTVAHQCIWVTARRGEDHAAWKLKAVNTLHVVLFPGYVAKRIVTTHGWGSSDRLRVSAFVNATGWAFWLAGLFLVLEGRRAILRRRPEHDKPRMVPVRSLDLSRRRFLVDAPLAVAGVVPAAGAVQAGLIVPWSLQVRRYSVAIRDLPRALDGLRLVQLSDTHLGPRVPADFVRTAVQRAMDLKPDVFLLTGDYVDGGTGHIDRAASILGALCATGRPVIGVLGNHDYYGDAQRMSRALAGQGVHMINNHRVFITDKGAAVRNEPPQGECLCVAGFADKFEDVIDADAALAGIPGSVPRIVLEHNPDAAELPEFTQPGAHRIDLMVSGHTHGGQVALPVLGAPVVPSAYGQKYAGGLVQGPAFPVLVSRGIGLAILPVRFGVPPELVEITLTRA